MFNSLEKKLDKDDACSSLNRVTKHQAPLLTKMHGDRDERRSNKHTRVIKELEEVLRAKRKLNATRNQSDTSIGIGRHSSDILQAKGSHSFQDDTTLQAEGVHIDSGKLDMGTKPYGTHSLALFDIETDKVIHYGTVKDASHDKMKEHIDQIHAISLTENDHRHVDDQMENLSCRHDPESLRYYEGQSKSSEVKQEEKENEVKKQRAQRLQENKERKKRLEEFPKTRWTKLCTVNIPDDLKLRTKDLVRIATMLCEQTRKETLLAKYKPGRSARSVYDDDSDDEDSFRPGVWGCEFSDENLADVVYYNNDLDITEPSDADEGDIIENAIKEVVKHVVSCAEKETEIENSENAFVGFFRRLFGIK